jgi:pilus assembly protein Flp/PilA
MDRINTLLIRLQNRRQDGQAMVEYGLILGLVSVVAVVALTTVGGDVNNVFNDVQNALGSVGGA